MNFKTRDKFTLVKPSLLVMVGCSRTGKSSWVNDFIEKHKNFVIVSGDDIRRSFNVEFDPDIEDKVKLIEKHMVISLLIRGQNVIVDDTNLTEFSRQKWYDIAVSKNLSDLHYIVVPPPLNDEKWKEICDKDNFPFELAKSQRERFSPPKMNNDQSVMIVANKVF